MCQIVDVLPSTAFTAAPFSHCVSWLSKKITVGVTFNVTASVRVCVPSLALMVNMLVPIGREEPGAIVRVEVPEPLRVAGEKE